MKNWDIADFVIGAGVSVAAILVGAKLTADMNNNPVLDKLTWAVPGVMGYLTGGWTGVMGALTVEMVIGRLASQG